MDAPSETQHFVLYFFCSTVREKSSAIAFIHTFLHQFVCCLPQNKQRAVITAFLLSLHNSILFRKKQFNEEVSFSNAALREILDASNDSDLWGALKKALDTEFEIRLSIIVDGLDRVKEHKAEFIRELDAFITHLLQRPWKPKAFLTSRPQDEIKEILDGLLCIEYDKERKGLTTFGFPKSN
jgi:hypothetical protein